MYRVAPACIVLQYYSKLNRNILLLASGRVRGFQEQRLDRSDERSKGESERTKRKGGNLLIANTRTVHLPRFDWSILAIKNGIDQQVLSSQFLENEIKSEPRSGDRPGFTNFSQQQNFHFMDIIPKQFLIGREVAVCHILVAYGSLQMVIIILPFLSIDTCFPIFISGFVYRFKVQLSCFSRYSIVVVL